MRHQGVAAVGLIAALAMVLGGCGFFTRTGLETVNRNEALQLQSVEHGDRVEGMGTVDDWYAKVAQQVPAFGGLFFDEHGQLTIYLADTAPSVVAAAAAIRSAFGDDERMAGPIRVLPGKYGFLQLYEWRNSIIDILTIPGVVFLDIDDRRNQLAVGVETMEIAHEVERMLEKLGVPREAVSIEKTEPIVFKLRQKRRPLVGGLQIQFGWPGANCTLGFIAVRQGINGFVTNSHCTHTQGGVENTEYHQPIRPINPWDMSNRVGLEIADPTYFTGGACPSGQRCRYSDSAFVRSPHPSGPSVTLNRGYIARTALGSINWNGRDLYRIVTKVETNDVHVGDIVNMVGRTSGRKEGTVFAVCSHANVGNITLLCQDWVNVGVLGGDSGAPVFRIINSPALYDVILYGILWGGDPAGTQYYIFSNMGLVQRLDELGPLQNCPSPFTC